MQVSATKIQKALIEDLLSPAASAVDRGYARDFLLDYRVSPVPTISELEHLERLEHRSIDPDSGCVRGISRSSLFVFSRFLRKVDNGVTRTPKDKLLSDFSGRQSLVLDESRVPYRHLRIVKRVCALLLGDLTEDVWANPRFGPGVVSEGNFGLDKGALPCPEWIGRKIDPLCRLRQEPGDNIATRILVVPKDWRGGRVIGAEPNWRMAAQLSTKLLMEKRLSCVIPFFDQSRQFGLLRDTSLGTVDLSNASDHVSVTLCREVLPPSWFHHLYSIRTDAHIVNGNRRRTESMALMGNGFCFPLLSLVVFSIAFAVLWADKGVTDVPSSRWDIVTSAKRWRVQTFGDDLVVPAVYFSPVCAALSSFGLVVNRSKSFDSSFFRETCGRYHFGEEGSSFEIPYLKQLSWDDDGALALQALVPRLWKSGYEHVAAALKRSCPFQVGQPKWNRNYQRFEYPGLSLGAMTRVVHLGDSTGYFHAFHGGIPLVENVRFTGLSSTRESIANYLWVVQ